MTKGERREYQKKYREKNIDKIRKYQRKYWAEHGEEINAKRRNRKCYRFRCKKAIEYIYMLKSNSDEKALDNLLDILKGSDKEC